LFTELPFSSHFTETIDTIQYERRDSPDGLSSTFETTWMATSRMSMTSKLSRGVELIKFSLRDGNVAFGGLHSAEEF